MGRIHLFEFEDQSWFPAFIRDYMTDYLQFMSNKLKIYQGALPILKKGLEKSKSSQILDMASGGGGGLLHIASELKESHPDLKIQLSDLYPNITAFEKTASQSPVFSFVKEPVDATEVPKDLKGFRTQFLSLHHLRPEQATKVLQNAVDAKAVIGIFETMERGPKNLIGMILIPLFVLLATPFVRPFSFGRLIFTYLIPLVPIFALWDGVVSVLRTYSIKEMNGLVANVNNQDAYEWEISKVKSGPGEILYLLGYPKSA